MGSAARRVLTFALVWLAVAACSVERDGPPKPTPTVTPPTSRIPANDLPRSDGIAVTEEQLARADPCALVDRQALHAYGQAEVLTTFHYTDCRFTFYGAGAPDLAIEFEFAFPEHVTMTPSVRNGVTVYGDAGSENSCRRGVVVSEDAVIDVSAIGDDPNITCPMADQALDTMLPELISGEIVPAGLPENSLAGLDACALLRPEEVFQVRGIDRTQVTPGFNGQVCTWGVPAVSDPNVYLNFSPKASLASYSDEERPLKLDGFDAVIFPVEGATTDDYTEPPGCEVRIEYEPDSAVAEEITLAVSADASDEVNCELATELAKAAVSRLPS